MPSGASPEDFDARIRKLRGIRRQSWSNLLKAAASLQGKPHVPFGTANVRPTTKSAVRLLLRETGLDLPALEERLRSLLSWAARPRSAFRVDHPTGHTASRILRLLPTFSQRQSYGLTVGGPASRVLAEFSLTDAAGHLRGAGVAFCRDADDFTVFCSSRPAALKALDKLSEILSLEGRSTGAP